MKKILLIFSFVFLYTVSYAQDKPAEVVKLTGKSTSRQRQEPKAYLGVSTGLNNPAGVVGVDFEVPVDRASNLGLNAGMGVGTWGTKIYCGLEIHFKSFASGWGLMGGLLYSTGMTNFKTTLNDTYGTSSEVILDFKPVVCGFIAGRRYWSVGKNSNRIFIELGGAVPFGERTVVQTGGRQLTDESLKRLSTLAPGGLTFGFGFSFGIR